MDTGIKTVFKNSIYIKVTKYLFPAILLIYAFIGINRGIDITDVGYNLGNYKYLSELDGMWFYSTFLANIIGALFTHLPFSVLPVGLQIFCKRNRSVKGKCIYRNVHLSFALLGSADMYLSLFKLLHAFCYGCAHIPGAEKRA